MFHQFSNVSLQKFKIDLVTLKKCAWIMLVNICLLYTVSISFVLTKNCSTNLCLYVLAKWYCWKKESILGWNNLHLFHTLLFPDHELYLVPLCIFGCSYFVDKLCQISQMHFPCLFMSTKRVITLNDQHFNDILSRLMSHSSQLVLSSLLLQSTMSLCLWNSHIQLFPLFLFVTLAPIVAYMFPLITY